MSISYNVNMGKAKQSAEGQRIIRAAKAMSEGVETPESGEESNKLWLRWGQGDDNALDLYIKSNVWLFVRISLKLKARFPKMDLEHIFSIIIDYSQTAFCKYDGSRGATVLSFHTKYAEYEVGHVYEKMSPLHSRQVTLLKNAKKLSFDTGMDLRSALIQVANEQNVCMKSNIKQYVDKIIAASSSKLSLHQPVNEERGAKLLHEVMEAPQEDLDSTLDIEPNRSQLEQIKAYITQDLSDRDKLIFQGMLKGFADSRIAESAGIVRRSIGRVRNRILEKTKRRANQLKNRGVRLPAIF